MTRRGAPWLVAAGFAALLVSAIIYGWAALRALQTEASHSGSMFAVIYRALSDTADGASDEALIRLSQEIPTLGMPLILTDGAGTPKACANLPFCDPLDTARARDYVPRLDRENVPMSEPALDVRVHFGNTPLVRALRIAPFVQLASLILLGVAAATIIRVRGRAARERVWAGMAREAAHQLGTPLSSMSGWLELLSQPDAGALLGPALAHMQGDLERLERVAHRFEHIGRPAKREPVDLVDVADRLATYFRARVPTLAHAVTVTLDAPPTPIRLQGDPVLLEWAMEALVRNAIDALAGRGGTVRISLAVLPEGGARVRVEDDGPGVPRELRSRIFEPGFSTKASGWGIGLSLARRIVEEGHMGTLRYVASGPGAVFEINIR